MFDTYRLLEIRKKNIRSINSPDALPHGFGLKNDTYEIICLEYVNDRTMVYKAINLKTSKLVTIKEFYPNENMGFDQNLHLRRNPDNLVIEHNNKADENLSIFSEMVKGYIEEAKYLEKISSCNSIIRFEECFEELGTAYVVLNYNEWPSLYDFFKSGYKFNEEEINWLTEALLDVVCKFHKKSAVHRNINPKNIYIKDDKIVLDSIGVNNILTDVKIYDSDSYKNNYFAPELTMHDGIISTWSDVYAIGKVMIELISSMTESGDYYDGLSSIKSGENREKYQNCIENSTSFYIDDRLVDAVEMKDMLFDGCVAKDYSKTPRSLVALIAVIAVISSIYVLYEEKNNSAEYSVTEEEASLGAVYITVDVESDFCFLTDSNHIFKMDSESIINWETSKSCVIKSLEIKDLEGSANLLIDLESDQSAVDMSSFIHKTGDYEISICYEVNGESLEKTLEVKFEE